jgi:hypothetical protein
MCQTYAPLLLPHSLFLSFRSLAFSLARLLPFILSLSLLLFLLLSFFHALSFEDTHYVHLSLFVSLPIY